MVRTSSSQLINDFIYYLINSIFNTQHMFVIRRVLPMMDTKYISFSEFLTTDTEN
jgi:hypothetical protein